MMSRFSGVFGAEDDLIPMEEVETFKTSLTTLKPYPPSDGV
jgi:hypothetical protein